MQLVKAATRAQRKQIHALYESAFPSYEKKPFWLIRLKNKQGKADIWYLEKENRFAGLAITMNAKDMVLLDYFAIADDRRGQGLGSEALKALQTYYTGRKFFLEIESVYAECDNREERLRRKLFYLKNDMTEMEMMVNLFGTDMEVLGYHCKLDFPVYKSVYEYAYGRRTRKHVTQREYKRMQ